jgi:mono/diheme cytochrome c family protein
VKRGILLVALAACTGTIGAEGDLEGGAGQAAYAGKVASMMRSQCSACHESGGSGPAFLGSTGGDDDYTAILSNARIVGGFEPANALVLTKGTHSGAQWWNADQLAAITNWLVKEREDFGAGNVSDLMAAWAGCMTIENWNDSKMASTASS